MCLFCHFLDWQIFQSWVSFCIGLSPPILGLAQTEVCLIWETPWQKVGGRFQRALVFYLSLSVSLCFALQENCGKVKNYGRLLGNHTYYATLENKTSMYYSWKKIFSPIYHIKSQHKKPRLRSRWKLLIWGHEGNAQLRINVWNVSAQTQLTITGSYM